jgi:bifunctional UDP-N-acetylglucosamine pyrophosphorylase/glucosamine-1-phosphate N-acetyltransferase
MEGKDLAVIILAAGKGSRMKSSLVKALHPLASRPLLAHVLDSVNPLNPERMVIITGHQSEKVRDVFKTSSYEFVEQKEQLGTGHAVQQAETALQSFEGTVLILCCDMPFLKTTTLRQLIEKHHDSKAECTLISLKTLEKRDFGRIVRDENGRIQRIVENRDASDEEKLIDEFNSGVYCFNKKFLFNALAEVDNSNSQQEYYLTDTIKWIKEKNLKVESIQTEDSLEILGINSIEDLELAENHLNFSS